MKKTLGLLLIFIAALAVLVACGGEDLEICFHEWEQNASEETLYAPATCLSAASYYSTCSLCGAKGAPFKSGDTSDHEFAEVVKDENLVSAATCTSRATYNKSCVHCGLVADETFTSGSPLAHNFVKKASVDTLKDERDCTHPNVYYYSCADCGDFSNQTFTLGPARPHSDSHGDFMCDYCNAALEVFDDVPVDNLTGIHHFGKKEGDE